MRILKIIRNIGKVNKDYYKYAVIEIVLIIAGILIAFELFTERAINIPITTRKTSPNAYLT
jgi:hypothetical protein